MERIVLDLTHLNPVVRLVGEHDLSTVEDIRRVVLGTLPATEAVVIDLGEVSFIDGSVLCVLLDLQHRAELEGARVEIAVPARPGSVPFRLVSEILPEMKARMYMSGSVADAQRSVDRWRAASHRRVAAGLHR